jgi:hypothetical protein
MVLADSSASAGTNPREERLVTAGIEKALETISAVHDINKPLNLESCKLAPPITLIPGRY